MSYIVRFEPRQGYLYAHMSGPESFAEAVRFWQDLAFRGRSGRFSRFLVVDEVTGQLSTYEHYDISVTVAELFRGKRIAYVDPKTATYEKNAFGEKVVSSRGVIARIFRSEPDAAAWLLDRDPP